MMRTKRTGVRIANTFVACLSVLGALSESHTSVCYAQARESPASDSAVPVVSPYDVVDDQGRPIAHLHRADMSCCQCTPTDADNDPDVFKRPCFIRALGRSRGQGFGASVGLTGGGPRGLKEIKLPAESLPPDHIQSVQSMLSNVLQRRYVPPVWDAIDFHGLTTRPHKMKMEMRNGVRTFAGYEPDLKADVILRAGNGIQAAWTLDGIDVLPHVRYRADPPRKAVIRLRLHGGERLKLGKRPENFTRLSRDFGAFFNPDAFHALLAKVLQVPFQTPEGFLVDGYDTEYEGVRVFHGRIRSRDWESRRRSPDAPRNPPHWWDEMRLLVTDSDPQYFCIQIVLRDEDMQ